MGKANKKWETVRRRGRRRFIFRRGVLGWGVSSWIVFTILRDTFGFHAVLDTGAVAGAFIGLLMFLAGGYFWGAAVWWFMEHMYGGSA